MLSPFLRNTTVCASYIINLYNDNIPKHSHGHITQSHVSGLEIGFKKDGEIYLFSREYKMCQKAFNRFPSFLSIRYGPADVDAVVVVVRRMCIRKDEINLDMEFS